MVLLPQNQRPRFLETPHFSTFVSKTLLVQILPIFQNVYRFVPNFNHIIVLDVSLETRSITSHFCINVIQLLIAFMSQYFPFEIRKWSTTNWRFEVWKNITL